MSTEAYRFKIIWKFLCLEQILNTTEALSVCGYTQSTGSIKLNKNKLGEIFYLLSMKKK